PAIINQMLRPHAIPPGILLLLIPEDAVVVGQAGDQIGQPIAIHVFGVDESGGAQLNLGMKVAVTVPRVAPGLKPALERDNARLPIPVDIARYDSVPVTAWSGFM